jgi:hypothetical protein
MSSTKSLLSVVDASLSIRAYGKIANDLALNVASEDSQVAIQFGATKPIFAWVYGIGFLGSCRALPKPLLLLMPDGGSDPSGCTQFEDPKEFRMWVLPKDGPVVALTQQIGPAHNVLAGDVSILTEVTSDFRVYNVRVETGKVKGRVRAYLRLRQPGPFGSTIFDIVVIDRDDEFSIDLNPGLCITVFSVGVASAQICYRDNPNRICGEVQVGIDLPVIGHWSKNFPIACVNF